MSTFPVLRFFGLFGVAASLLAGSLCSALTISWAPSPASGTAQAITNGSFESDFTGWTVTGNQFIESGGGYTASDGTKLVSFNGNSTSDVPPNAVLSQTFATIPGTTYTLTFDMGVIGGSNTVEQKLEITVQGTGNLLTRTVSKINAASGVSQWTAQSYTFLADNTTATLTFRDISLVTAGADALLDNVRVTSTTPDVLGYRVHYGTSSGNYTNILDAGSATSVQISNPPAGVTYFAVVTAYAAASIESLPSVEVSYTGTGSTVSTNADLATLTHSGGTLSPAFGSGTTSYSASVPNSTTSIAVTPTAAQANATVKVNGVSVPSGSPSAGINLAVGSNTINTVVTAQDGTTTKTYTLAVSRAPSSTADLASLVSSAGALSPAFASGITSYAISVPNATTSITITPIVGQANATVKVNGVTIPSGSSSAAINLGVGITPINTVVTAQDGSTTKTYSLSVTRAPSGDASLTALVPSVGTLSPAFASSTLSYSLGVPTSSTYVTITPTASQASATVKINGFTVSSGIPSPAIDLSTGSATIKVVVAAPDGTTRTYTLAASQQVTSDVAGTYNGLATPTGSSTNRARHVGLGNVTVSASGAFTGKLMLGGSSVALPFSGSFGAGSVATFSPSGTAMLSIPRTDLPTLSLALNLDRQVPVTSRISGTLTDESGTIVSTLILERSLYADSTTAAAPMSNVPTSLLDPAKDNGAYTAIFQARTPDQQGTAASGFPQGDGWAIAKVMPTGTVSVTGKLADGQAFTYSGSLSKSNVLPLYLTPYSGAGTVLGSLTFRDIPSQSDVDGVGVQWFKPANSADSSYRAGWPNGIQVDFLGSKFVASSLTGKTPLGNDPVTSPTVNGLFMLSDAGLLTPLSNNLSIGLTSRATVLGTPSGGTAASSLALTFSSNGTISGSFKHSTWKTTPTFAGVVMQKTRTAGGYFLAKRSSSSTLQSGSATISPVTAAPATIAAN